MIPKHEHLNRVFNNSSINDKSNELNYFRKYYNDNNSGTGDQLKIPNESFLKPVSPLILKRSSLIKYDDCLVNDCTNDQIENLNQITVHEPEKCLKSPSFSIFKTGSISSLKISSLTEQWPSSEYVQTDRLNARTHMKSDNSGVPLPDSLSVDSFGNNSILTINQPIVSEAIQIIPPLSFSSDKAALSSCLSKCDSVSKFAATDIMKLMDFTDMSLVEALQNFVRKIPVIGESQERDRILTYFTDRFMTCNPGAYRDNDSCHTLVCALMLLNTDIHGQVSKKRMTCKEFVDNVLGNFPDNGYVENDLINMYNFIRKTELRNEETADSSSTLRHKFSRLITKSPKQTPDVISINIDPSLLNQQRFISGNIMRKCIKKSFGKKPALGHRGWKLQFASLIGLQLLLFKTNLNKNDGRSDQNEFNGDRVSLTDSNISSELLRNDDSSLSLSINNGPKSILSKLPSSCSRDNVQVSVDDVESCIKIHHGFASVVEKLRHKNVFSLRLADQAEYFFKVKSDQLHRWIYSINYAAAILSAPPIVGAGQCGLYKPLLPGYLTDLDKVKQMQSHETQITQYRESLKKLQLVNSKARSINEPQIRFCKYEMARFDTYLKLLKSQSIDECRSDQTTRRPDINSIFSIMDPDLSHSVTNTPLSTRSINPGNHAAPPDDLSDMATLCRRPNKVSNPSRAHPMISRTASSPSAKIRDRKPIQMSPTADSLHSCAMPNQYYIPLATRPVVYSPQIGSHFQWQQPQAMQSFSRFVDPSYSINSYNHHQSPPILSPLTTARLQHYQLPSFVSQSQSVTKLPKYSPPSSRLNISRI